MQHGSRVPLESDESIQLNQSTGHGQSERGVGEGVKRVGKEQGGNQEQEIKGHGDSNLGNNSTGRSETNVRDKEELSSAVENADKSIIRQNGGNEGVDRASGGDIELTQQSDGGRVGTDETRSVDQTEPAKEGKTATEGDRLQAIEPNSTNSASSQPSPALSSTTATETKSTNLDPPSTSSTLPLPTSAVSSTLPASATRSVSPNPPVATKRFSSSLSVNKKFLEKAGEKANKVETKPITSTVSLFLHFLAISNSCKADSSRVYLYIARLATPPTPNPVSTSHPRLLTGKISTSNPSIALSTSTSSTSSASQPTVKWSKKTPSSAGSLPPTSSTSSAAGKIGPLPGKANGVPLVPKTSGPVWSSTGAASTTASPNQSSGASSSAKSYGGIGLGRGGGGGGFGNFVGDFPTAAEAAYGTS